MTIIFLSTRRQRWRYRRRGWWLSLRWSLRPPWYRPLWCGLTGRHAPVEYPGGESPWTLTVTCARCCEVLRDS